MQRTLSWLSAVCLVVALGLGVALWRQGRACAQAATELAARQAAVDELRAQETAAVRPGSGAVRPPAAKPVMPAAVAPVVEDEALREDRRIVADRAAQMFRRNALNSYRSGFEALRLPPEILAQAKEIIVAHWQSAAEARQAARSPDEFRALVQQGRLVLEDRLATLIGPDACAALTASTREGSLDWTIGTDMWDGGAPLQPEQLRSLALVQTQLHIESRDWVAAPGPRQTPDERSELSAQDLEMLAATAGFLAPEQQAILRQSLIDENRYNAAMHAFAEKQARLARDAAATAGN